MSKRAFFSLIQVKLREVEVLWDLLNSLVSLVNLYQAMQVELLVKDASDQPELSLDVVLGFDELFRHFLVIS